MTLISRLLGFLREAIVARVFGVSAATDAFYVAYRIPNFLRQLFAEGAFSMAFVPVLAEVRERRDPVLLKELIDRVAGTLAAILSLVVGIGILAAPGLVTIFAPGFLAKPDKFALASDLLRITMPYILLVSLAGFAGGILNAHRRFVLPALAPILLNLAMIAGALLWARHFTEPITALAWSIIVGGSLQLIVLAPALARLGLLPRPRWGWRHPGVRKILSLMLPVLFGASVMQLNLMFDTIIASLLQTGSVTWLYQADRMLQFPQGVFGVALATVILPHLSSAHSAQAPAEFSRALDWGLRTMLLIALPAALGLALLAEPILWTLFGYGRYTARDVEMAAISLSILALGLPAFMAVKVLAPGFFARQDSKTPVKAGVASIVSNMLLNAVLVGALVLLGFHAPHAGLSLASVLAGYLNAGLLWFWLHAARVHRAEPGWPGYLARLLSASAVMSLGLAVVRARFEAWGEWSGAERLGVLVGLLAGAALLYLGTLWLLGIRPRDLLDRRAGDGR